MTLRMPTQAQVLTNLVWNAAKFTPAGGQVSVTLSRDGVEAVVRVRDNGIGIAPAMQTGSSSASRASPTPATTDAASG